MYKKPENDQVQCLECGDRITYGRSDKKFCCERCKNSYNNRRIHAYRNLHMRVLGILDRNHEILEGLLKMGITSIDAGDLAQMGYNNDYATAFYKTRRRTEIRCFDIKYYCSENKIYSIEKVVTPI